MADIGLYGLGVMGQNLVRNIARNGYSTVVYNRTSERTERFIEAYGNERIEAAYDLETFVASLDRPRQIILLVKAGKVIDLIIDQLKPYLEPGDTLIDGGNSHYADTDRRIEMLAGEGLHFMGVGISGGEEGALWGPSLMPSGPREAYERVGPILRAIAAAGPDRTPCVTYLGHGSAGHYVKMVHNGIEYAIMQAIAEVYDLLRRAGRLSPAEIGDLFGEWDRGELASFLVQITSHVLHVEDEATGRPLIDMILDRAKQKGTGKWTTQDALDIGYPVPSISAAVEARIISAFKQERTAVSPLLDGPVVEAIPPETLIPRGRASLYAAMLTAYAQGFALLRGAAEEYGYEYRLAEVAMIWRAGCIIRAQLLESIRAAFAAQPALPNLLAADSFSEALVDRQQAWREALVSGIRNGIPVPVLGASLAYYDSYRTERLPANLIQAQRDFFGSHTYERVDREGTFHTDWQAVAE